MAYITVAELKLEQGIDGTADDALLLAHIAEAQDYIEKRTHKVFEAAADTTRQFTVGEDTIRRELWFDTDICAITTVKTDADDGNDGDTIPATDYVTMPRNFTPYYAIKILSSSDYDWEYTDDPEAGIEITGKWAYSTSAPDVIKRCTKRMALYFYKVREAQVFDTTAIPDAGVILVPKGIPADVDRMLRDAGLLEQVQR